MTDKSALLILADGFEEIEALGTLDVLRRLHCNVRTAGLGSLEIAGSHGIQVRADVLLENADFESAAAIILPGGLPGATNLRDSQFLRSQIRDFARKGKLLCAICAAPTVLAAAGVLEGKHVTGYPGCEPLSGVPLHFSGAMVEHDGRIVTGKGPGATFRFAAETARALGVSDQEISNVLKGMFVSE